MAANLTIYCLGEVTDYSEFERLCHDLMSLVGYSKIEPLGGFSDRGRDAVHVSTTNGVTIFAYSVREDWRAKLSEDAHNIHKHGHTCNTLVFVTTAGFSVGERDEAIGFIRDMYGWNLELYGLERLRVLLDTQYPQIKANHPQIFPPAFLAIEAQVKKSEQRDHLFINYAAADTALAEWLARKLTAEGYFVWCERFELLGGESYPDDVDSAIHTRACRVIALYSEAALSDKEASRQRTIALGISSAQIPNFVVPLRVDNIPAAQLDQSSRRLVFVPFETNWAKGLQQLLQKLDTLGCPKLLPNGKRIAAEAFLEKDVLSNDSETIVTNCLQVEKIPNAILFFGTKRTIPHDKLDEMKFDWAYRFANGKFLSFQPPPPVIATKYELKSAGRALWRGASDVERVATGNLVSELLRKSLLVHCLQKGLRHCSGTGLHYFPLGLVEGERIKYRRPDGKNTYVNATGQRTYMRADSGSMTFFRQILPYIGGLGTASAYLTFVAARMAVWDSRTEPCD